MLSNDIYELLICSIAILVIVGLIIYIVHCFPIQTFIIFTILITALFFNEIKYMK